MNRPVEVYASATKLTRYPERAARKLPFYGRRTYYGGLHVCFRETGSLGSRIRISFRQPQFPKLAPCNHQMTEFEGTRVTGTYTNSPNSSMPSRESWKEGHSDLDGPVTSSFEGRPLVFVGAYIPLPYLYCAVTTAPLYYHIIPHHYATA